MTAAAVLLLAGEGRSLALGDDVRRWVPELPDYGKTITLDHLLHHTSGLRDLVQLLPVAGHAEADVVTADEALWLVARQRSLNFPRAPSTSTATRGTSSCRSWWSVRAGNLSPPSSRSGSSVRSA